MGLVDISAGFDASNPRTWFQTGLTIARNAIYADDPLTQIATNIVILVVAMLSSAVGFLPGLFIALAALFFAGVGVVRLLYQSISG